MKDPVLNFMNINKETINVLNTALRLGMDFDTIALLLSSKAISTILENYRKNSLTGKTSFDNEVKKAIRDLEGRSYIGKDSSLQSQDLTKEEMIFAIRGVKEGASKEEIQEHNKIAYKILNAVKGLSDASKTAQPLTDLTRLNSITSAPGPLHINTLASDRKFGPAMSMRGIIKFVREEVDGEGVEYTLDATRDMVFKELPSLEAFYTGYDIVKQLFKKLGFTTATDAFQSVLNQIPQGLEFTMWTKEKLMSSLADFFQSYLLVQSGVIKAEDLKRYTTEFVTDFIGGRYTTNEKVANNPLIKAIKPKLLSKPNEEARYALEIDTTGMEQSEKDILSAGWAQLEKDDSELSHKLFVYNFFRGGIGFNPKSFMSLLPIQVKEQIGGYIETFAYIPNINKVTADAIFDQWVRNNWSNTDLVTKVTDKYCAEGMNSLTFRKDEMYKVYNSPYIRVPIREKGKIVEEVLFKETSGDGNGGAVYTKITPLGNNREYLEMYKVGEPITNTNNVQRGVATLETEEYQIGEMHEDSPETQQTPEEQARDLQDFYQTAYAETTAEETQRESIDNAFEKANKDLDIQTNRDKFENIMEDFC